MRVRLWAGRRAAVASLCNIGLGAHGTRDNDITERASAQQSILDNEANIDTVATTIRVTLPSLGRQFDAGACTSIFVQTP